MECIRRAALCAAFCGGLNAATISLPIASGSIRLVGVSTPFPLIGFDLVTTDGSRLLGGTPGSNGLEQFFAVPATQSNLRNPTLFIDTANPLVGPTSFVLMLAGGPSLSFENNSICCDTISGRLDTGAIRVGPATGPLVFEIPFSGGFTLDDYPGVQQPKVNSYVFSGSGVATIRFAYGGPPGQEALTFRDATYVFTPEPATWLTTGSVIVLLGLARLQHNRWNGCN